MPTTYYDNVNGRLRGQVTAGVRTGYLTDALGSVTATVQAAAVVNTYRYKPYGTQLAKTGAGADPKFGWAGDTGSRKSALSFAEQYNRWRTLALALGLWTSRDLLWPAEPAYTYATANPVTMLDALGLFTHTAYRCAAVRTVTGFRIDVSASDRLGIASGCGYPPPHCQTAQEAAEYCRLRFDPVGRVAVVNGSYFVGVGDCRPVSPVMDCLGRSLPGAAHEIDVAKGAEAVQFGAGVVWGRNLHKYKGAVGCNLDIQAPSSRTARTVLVEQGGVFTLYVLGAANARELCSCFPGPSTGVYGRRTLIFDGGGSTQFWVQPARGRAVEAVFRSERAQSNYFWIGEPGGVSIGIIEPPDGGTVSARILQTGCASVLLTLISLCSSSAMGAELLESHDVPLSTSGLTVDPTSGTLVLFSIGGAGTSHNGGATGGRLSLRLNLIRFYGCEWSDNGNSFIVSGSNQESPMLFVRKTGGGFVGRRLPKGAATFWRGRPIIWQPAKSGSYSSAMDVLSASWLRRVQGSVVSASGDLVFLKSGARANQRLSVARALSRQGLRVLHSASVAEWEEPVFIRSCSALGVVLFGYGTTGSEMPRIYHGKIEQQKRSRITHPKRFDGLWTGSASSMMFCAPLLSQDSRINTALLIDKEGARTFFLQRSGVICTAVSANYVYVLSTNGSKRIVDKWKVGSN